MREILIYTGSIIIMGWGIAHIVPVKSIVKSFNDISADNKLILTMEWIAEGLTLAFIGTLVILVSVLGDSVNETSRIIYLSSAVMLLVLAVLSLFTGARTSVLPMKICPAVKSITALILFTRLCFRE